MHLILQKLTIVKIQIQVWKLSVHKAFQELNGLPIAVVFEEVDTTSSQMFWKFVGWLLLASVIEGMSLAFSEWGPGTPRSDSLLQQRMVLADILKIKTNPD